MSLKLDSVKNGKTPDKEVVWIEVTSNTNLKGYALVDKTFDSEEKVSNEFRHVFFFPDVIVEKGDWVAVTTGVGKNKTSSVGGLKFHWIYWQSDKCVWNDAGGDNAWLIKYTIENKIQVPPVINN
ncbi:hypothetical protein [Flavobacterium hercynium]|nr:hypothetical protein [Flavobacterium hercynium]SMP22011.1 hypothetical protein SAMN06265346_107107 [Flavobacterium hercynium]